MSDTIAFDRTYEQDLLGRVETQMGGMLFVADARSLTVGVNLSRGGVPLTGVSGTVIARAIRSDGVTVEEQGGATGGTIYATLEASCFVVAGPLIVTLQVVSGSVKTTLARIIFDMVTASTDVIVDPGNVVPDLSEIIAMYDDVRAATAAAEAAATKSLVGLKASLSNASGSINVFDYAFERLAGKYADYEDGNIKSNANYVCYHYIPVKPGQTFWLTTWTAPAHICYHDIYGDYINGEAVSPDDVGAGKIVIPNDCYYLSVSYGEILELSNNGWKSALIPIEYFWNQESSYLVKATQKNYGAGDLKSYRNLLPYNYGGVKDYFYIYDSGVMLRADGYVAVEIPALPGTAYFNPINNGHYSFFSANGAYISGVCNLNTFTTPSNCAFMRIGYQYEQDNAHVYSALIANQSANGVYSEFGTGDVYQIKSNIPKVITVGVNQDCATIGEAIALAQDDDTILIFPGVYEETLNAYAKRLHIKGVSREHCILQYSANDYNRPPLHMAKGSVEDLTIYAHWEGDETQIRAYCVHIDNINERGETLLFENVSFLNERGACVGIGLRTNCHLKFHGCTFHTTATGYDGPIYNHTSEYETEGSGGYAVYENQNVEYVNCIIINETTNYSIHLQSQERRDKCCKITFIGNRVIQPNNNGKTITMSLWEGRTLTNTNYLGSSDFVLTDLSEYNSHSIMDYSGQI